MVIIIHCRQRDRERERDRDRNRERTGKVKGKKGTKKSKRVRLVRKQCLPAPAHQSWKCTSLLNAAFLDSQLLKITGTPQGSAKRCRTMKQGISHLIPTYSRLHQ